ncbi:1-phosphofructokinase [Yersinia ruckeri]|uniref:6-phosphofructokinase II n=1 Tax=Yersinia ruckeri TaxID=29486 RepID=UPI0005AC1435|nr:6-phosphofructokinase II [Yersinia ruckeri]AJI96347.1 1-phosphofructokinase [Yersinia ruckeri]MCW6567484.1 6-phosphofructokinase II [Yersinia ruckeri]
MTRIFTLTLSPSLDSATTTAKMYPEGKLRCTVPVFEPGGGGINVARAVVYLGGQATAIFPIGGPTGEHLSQLLVEEGVQTETLKTQDWTRQNLHVHVDNSGEQFRFVMPGARLNDAEFEQLMLQVQKIPTDSILVISGSLPPGISTEKLTHLIRQAKLMGLQCIVDSSGEALKACLDLGGLALVKPNHNELSALVGRPLDNPDDVRSAAQEIVQSGGSQRVVVSLGPQGALAVDREHCVQIVPPPVKKMSTVGAGDSMVGAMTLKLANGAELLDIVRFGVAAGSAATLNLGTRLCSLADTQRLHDYLCKN